MRLLPIEWTAIGFAAVLLGLTFFSDPLYRATWFLGGLAKFVVWIIAGFVTIFSIGWALDGFGNAARRGLAMPLAILAVILLSGAVFDVGRWTFARIELERQRSELEQQAKSQPGSGVAVEYLDGIPDGGVAIVRSAVDPALLPDRTQAALVGEPIHRCQRLEDGYFACSYD